MMYGEKANDLEWKKKCLVKLLALSLDDGSLSDSEYCDQKNLHYIGLTHQLTSNECLSNQHFFLNPICHLDINDESVKLLLIPSLKKTTTGSVSMILNKLTWLKSVGRAPAW